MSSITYRIDIDNTIAKPQWYHRDLNLCIQYYVEHEIINAQDIAKLGYHTQLFMLPHVAITHIPMPGAVEALQQLAQEGFSIEYYTARNSVEPEKCKRMHENTYIWLEKHQFPNSNNVSFVWDISEKWINTRENPGEYTIIVDDRPHELLQAYRMLAKQEPQTSINIQKHMILVAFQHTSLEQLLTDSENLRIFPLSDWLHFPELAAKLQRECLYR
jgi:hypothetical protein